ncbi:MAG TPA: hypothetical protein VFY59_02265 [Rubrobacter sp.]|nr:hypothetical protein [Rubrobacter sp.]
MGPMQRDPEPWRELSEALEGHLEARARGLLASGFVLLDRGGTEVGRLDIQDPAGADLTAGEVEARIERVGQSGYAMHSSGEEILASTADPTSPGITSRGHPYKGGLSLLRNRAEAGPKGHATTIHIRGGLTNRTYQASFDTDDEYSLPVTLFLLYRLISQRSRAYRAS